MEIFSPSGHDRQSLVFGRSPAAMIDNLSSWMFPEFHYEGGTWEFLSSMDVISMVIASIIRCTLHH
jgi:hypothetical protein